MKNVTQGFTKPKKEVYNNFVKFLGLRSFQFLRQERGLAEDLASVFTEVVSERAMAIKKRFGVSEKRITMRDVRRICKAENIKFSTIRPKGAKKSVLGQYTYPTEIWIDGKLPQKHRRFIAAHELAHHFLSHGEKIANKTLDYSELPQHLQTEFEADLCAAILLIFIK